jgi:hypothetical protein
MMTEFSTCSKRMFSIAFLEGESTFSMPGIRIERILNPEPDGKDYEHYYAMQENIDGILDLKVGERLTMKFNRDNSDSDGFIKRLK